MTDFEKQLESGIESNGVYQRVIPVYCYIDIPISIVIKKLELANNKSNKFVEFLNSKGIAIYEWIKSNPDKTFELIDYINFLQIHLETTRDFVRFGLASLQGIYVKISTDTTNDEFFGLGDDYIQWYDDLALEYDLVMEPIQGGTDLRSIPSTKIRPTLKWKENPEESIKTIFYQTSFRPTEN